MKVLAIIGSPTGNAGYTTHTVQALERSLVARAGATVEYLHLVDLGLGGCQGHLTCVKFGEDRCPFSKDVGALSARMAAADVVIFASPVHCFNVSTLMKNMIDLFVFQMHRPAFFGKKAIVVSTAAGAGQGPVLKYMAKTFANWGFQVVGRLGTHAGLFNERVYQEKLIQACDRVTTQLLNASAGQGLPRPGLAELINFRVWRAVVVRSRQASPFDWHHWESSGWMASPYYYSAPVNPLSNAIATFIERMIDRAIRKVSVGPVT